MIEIKINHDPQFSVNHCDVSHRWLLVEIYNDATVEFELDRRGIIILTAAQLRRMAVRG